MMAAMGRLLAVALAFLTCLSLGADAAVGRRVALVVGNGTYEDAGTLANPVNDALDMAAKLRAVGFEVIEGHDLGKRDLERKVGEFSDRLAGADVGLFFYAGHGLQVDGRNFLVPVDARVDVPVKLTLETVPIDEVLDIMEQLATTSLVFLDACRNNPFVRAPGKASDRSARALAGLAQFDTTRGSFIAFSTAPGSVALDGSGRNSPFAESLLTHLDTPGQSINDLMIAVRRDVVAATRGQQRPWEQGSLVERFEFVPQDGAAPAPVAKQPAPAATEVASLERSVGDAPSVEAFVRDAYLAPQAGDIAGSVGRVYADPATIYGTPLGAAALVKTKADWFAQWSAWRLELEPGTLSVVARGEDRADVAFDMRYDYVPKGQAVARATGRARVALGLVRSGDGWRVASETSQPLP